MRYEKGTFIVIPNKQQLKGLTVGARALFVELCDMADENGQCFPTRKTLAERLKSHPNSIDKWNDELIADGFLTKITRKREDGSYFSNLYQIELLSSANVVPSTKFGDTPSVLECDITVSSINCNNARETKVSHSFEEMPLNADGEPREPRTKKDPRILSKYNEVIDWSVKQRGFDFPSRTRQYKYLKEAREAGISITRLKNRWEELMREDWRHGKIDWGTVIKSFDKEI